jgi:hypothetical protein
LPIAKHKKYVLSYNKRFNSMPRKTLALISGLVLVTVILFVVALRASKEQAPAKNVQTAPPAAMQQVSPTAPAHTVLSLSPNPVSVAPGQTGTVSVDINTEDNQVTAVQLELQYDPMTVSNVKVVAGPLFSNPVVLINKNDTEKGRVTYAFGIAPNNKTVNGTGAVATITFTAKGAAGKNSELTLLPTSLVTARGVASSVLKSSTGTTIMVGAAGGATGAGDSMQKTTTVQPTGY